MPPKKAQSKSKGNVTVVFSETEKAFYELQLADCNKKLARLRKSVSDYEIRNEELQKAYDQLDEDRSDVIEHLKKTLLAKTEENSELKDKVRDLEELRVIEIEQFKDTVNRLENDFKKMKDQLTSENKLLAGKLNTLEEFRAIKEDLMQKFENQEHAFHDQEIKYRRIIYDTEKQFTIDKDKLKKEMEEKLLKLAQDFQDASELRIAASTHRVIRENVALNNQLDSLLMTQTKVAEENENFRKRERAARCAMEVAETERDKAMNKSILQLKVIDQLTEAFEDVRKQKALYEKHEFDIEKMHAQIQKQSNINDKLSLQVRILEQHLHAALGEQNKTVVETAKLITQRKTFKKILRESAFAVQASLKMDQWAYTDRSREFINREVVLNKILDVINQYHDIVETESMESLVSLSNIYEKGDVSPSKKLVSSKNTMPQVTGSGPRLSYEDKRSALSSSSRSSSYECLKTLPSIEVMPVEDKDSLPTPKDSLPSFTVVSPHSSDITEESDSVGRNISKMLDISRLEMQKSLMKELAMSYKSLQLIGDFTSKANLDPSSKIPSAGIIEGGPGYHVEFDNQHKTKESESAEVLLSDPTQDTSEPTQPASEPTQPASEATQLATEAAQLASEATQPASEATQPASEPTQDIGDAPQDEN